MTTYERAPEGKRLRLHLNENTGGCSPRVLEAIARLTTSDVARYPDYEDVVADCATYLDVTPRRLLLTNGLDEGILTTTLACFRSGRDRTAGEGLIVEPAFETYAVCLNAVSAPKVAVPLGSDFSFPADEVLDAITPATRLIFLTNPNNPTGQRIPAEAIRAIARRAAPRALVFLDEAYCDFAGETFLRELDDYPNIVIGRTFAKSHGLAALRIGALIGHEDTLALIRRNVLPYTTNVCAAVGLRAALEDRDHVARYVSEVGRSKQLLYDACERLGLKYWPSAANFVLIQTGEHAARLIGGLASRGIFVRDRTRDPHCTGCIRITAGIVEHTAKCIEAMEEVMCDGR